MPEWTGDWRVEVRDSRGNVLETIRFTVRGQANRLAHNFWDATARLGEGSRLRSPNSSPSPLISRTPRGVLLLCVSRSVPSEAFGALFKTVGNHRERLRFS